MPTLKKRWDKFLEYSTAAAAMLILTIAAVGLLLVVGVAVVIAKVSVFVR